MVFIYTGIGARKTPTDVLDNMQLIARKMAKQGYILRSGGADGADSAFEVGCDQVQGKKEIYLPWKRFNNNPSEFMYPIPEAYTIAAEFHPNWKILSNAAQNFMARNAHQILGQDLKTKANLVICWTPKGQIIGGTGQALRMAEAFNIPVMNLFNQDIEIKDDGRHEIIQLKE